MAKNKLKIFPDAFKYEDLENKLSGLTAMAGYSFTKRDNPKNNVCANFNNFFLQIEIKSRRPHITQWSEMKKGKEEMVVPYIKFFNTEMIGYDRPLKPEWIYKTLKWLSQARSLRSIMMPIIK
jgi:hypothetical protein